MKNCLNDKMKFATSLLFVLTSGLLLAEKPSFDRYKSIVDRHPFGPPPPGFNPDQFAHEAARATSAASAEAKEVSKEQEALQKAISFNMLNIEDDGSVMVGFTDKSDAKRPKCYYLAVGQTQDGWHVKDADPVSKTTTIEKDSVEISLVLGGESGATPAGAAAQAAAQATPRSSLLGGRSDAAGSSHMSRRAAREAQAKAEREKAAAEAARQREATKQELAEMKKQMAAELEEAAAEREREREAQRKALEALQAKQQELQSQGGGDAGNEGEDD